MTAVLGCVVEMGLLIHKRFDENHVGVAKSAFHVADVESIATDVYIRHEWAFYAE